MIGPGSPRPADDATIERAVELLAAGDAIGLPTETVYGLAADAGNRDAVARIYRIKGRPVDHPLIVHVHDAHVAMKWAWWSAAGDDRAQRLADAFWPGPLTLVLERLPTAPPWACAGQPTIALRAPSHPVARAVLGAALTRGIAGLAAPSANRFGRVSPTRAAHVRDDLGADVALVLEGGDSDVGIESTIVDVSGPTTRVLRPGAITAAQIEAVLSSSAASSSATSSSAAPSLAAPPSTASPSTASTSASASGAATASATECANASATASATAPAARSSARPVVVAGGDVPRVPGSLRSHYAPITRITLCPPERLERELAARLATGARLAVWSRERPQLPVPTGAAPVAADPAQAVPAAAGPAQAAPTLIWRQRPDDPRAFAHGLYDGLRALDALGCDGIVIEQPPHDADWAGVNDRLTRASDS